MGTLKADTIRTLRKGRERIAKGFCKFSLALDADGRQVDPHDPEAASWCCTGAVMDSDNIIGEPPEVQLACALLSLAVPGENAARAEIMKQVRAHPYSLIFYTTRAIIRYNNLKDTTKQDALDLFDRAITDAEEALQ